MQIINLCLLIWLFLAFYLYFFREKKIYKYRRKKLKTDINTFQQASLYKTQQKPKWVIDAILILKEQLPSYGCRKLADQFNQIYFSNTGISVGKTWVAETIKNHKYRCVHQNKLLKHKVPHPLPKNKIWAMDTTIIKDKYLFSHPIIGIIDHGSRVLTRFKKISHFNTWTALGHLFIAIGEWGKPDALRTDNHAVFHSKLWKAVLNFIGIRIQHSSPCCPWQNGRIERFFLTFKERLKYYHIENMNHLSVSLGKFEYWYNYIRPHQHLSGWSPIQVWKQRNPYVHPVKAASFFNEWGGVLRGIDSQR